MIEGEEVANDLVVFGTTYADVSGFKATDTNGNTRTFIEYFNISDYEDIQTIVRQGDAQKYFDIGDQILTTWSPNGTTIYDMPWDVVDFGSVVDANGTTHTNAMWLQSHYTVPAMQLSGNNAFYVPSSSLPAGTYHFTIGTTWGSKCIAGKVYQFTTTQAVPANGQLVIGLANSNTSGMPDTAQSNWRVRTFSNGLQVTPTEILTLSEGSGGTDLGTMSDSVKFATSGINNLHRASYGYNRWSVSALRQWLNSSGATGEWWQQMYAHDHRPDSLATTRGFLAGLPSDFLNIINPIRVTTALNTLSDSEIGTNETTTDRFFLASLEQEYTVADRSGEGSSWDYWEQRLGSSQSQSATNAQHSRYKIDNHSTADAARFRSVNVSSATSTHIIYAGGGHFNNIGATFSYGFCPACVIY